jgi:DNA-directed RNA polymerase subunit beta'
VSVPRLELPNATAREPAPAFFRRPGTPTWNSLHEGLITDDQVRNASHGSVESGLALDAGGTPVRGGPRCQRIFGPVVSYRCGCGRYAGEVFAGLVCERCGVELISSQTRGWRHGHVSLASRVLHPWYLDTIAAVLGLTRPQLTDVLELRRLIVVDPLDSGCLPGDVLHEPEPEAEVGTGPEALAELLTRSFPEVELRHCDAGTLKHDVLTVFHEARLLPGRLVLEVLAVPPPEAPVPGGRTTRQQLEEALREVLARNDQVRAAPTEQHQRALQGAVTEWFACF